MKNFTLFITLFLLSTSLAFPQWQKCNNGIFGGSVNNIVVGKGHIFAGTNYSGVYVSSDNGKTWSERNNGLKYLGIKALAMKDNVLYAGTDDGIFVTTDYGYSWYPRNDGLQSQQRSINSIAFLDNRVYAATWDGLFVSIDGGPWKNDDNMPESIITNIITHAGKLIASSNSSIYQSTDKGQSWETQVNYSLGIQSIAARDSLLFIGQKDYGIEVIDISGDYWGTLYDGLPGNNVHAVAVRDSIVIAGTDTGGVFISTDNGQSWTQRNSGLMNKNILSLAVSGDTIFAGTWGGGLSFSSDNGRSWQPFRQGFDGVCIWTISMDNNNLFTRSDNGIFLSTDNGSSWQQKNIDIPASDLTTIAAKDGKLFVGTYKDGLFASTDKGDSWVNVYHSPVGEYQDMILHVFLIGNNIFATLGDFEFLSSTDKGNTWNVRKFPTSNVNDMIETGGKIFAATEFGVYVSEDLGATWQQRNSGMHNISVRSLVSNGSDIYAATNSNGVFFSSDYGSSWTYLNSSYACGMINSIAMSGSYIFVASMDKGVSVSTDNGKKWIKKNDGLPVMNIQALAIKGNDIYAGTNGSGMFRASISDLLTSIDEPVSGTSPCLVYPNPASDKLHIRLDSYKDIDIKIFNLLGQELLSVIPSGPETTINLESLPKGTYFLRLGSQAQFFIKE